MTRRPILHLAAITGYLAYLTHAIANSVCDQRDYYSLRPCAQGCVGCADSRADQIAFMIGCGHVPPNECWCATELFTVATSALSACVSTSCTIGGWESDYMAAEAFYTSYCQGAGFTGVTDGGDIPVRTTGVSPGGGGGSGSGGGGVVETTTITFPHTTVTRTVVNNGGPTPTNIGGGDEDRDGDGAGGSSENGLTKSDKIALGVGIGLGLPATIACVIICIVLIQTRVVGKKKPGGKPIPGDHIPGPGPTKQVDVMLVQIRN